MLYKLLIAEDENFIREAIVECIDWKELGFEVRAAADGEEALDLTKEFPPDALLTDIRMPFIDGIELTHQLMKDYPQLITIVLSGHDEFSYAQDAIKSGVKDYLVKPIRPKVLMEAMSKVKLELDRQRAQSEDLKKLRSQLHESMPLLREQYLTDILEHPASDSVLQRMDYLNINLKGSNYTVCVLTHNPFENIDEEYLMRFAITNVLQEKYSKNAQAFCDPLGRHFLIFYGDYSLDRDELFKNMEAAMESVKKLIDVELTAAIGKPVRSLKELPISCQSALSALDQQVLLGKGRIYDAKDHFPNENGSFLIPFEATAEIVPKLKFDSDEDFQKAIDLYFETIREHNLHDLTNLYVIFIDLINQTTRLLSEYNYGEQDELRKIFEDLFSCSTLSEMQILLKEHLFDVKARIEKLRRSRSTSLLDKACHYIQLNYGDNTLSLSAVAKQVYITGSYLSVLFKRELNTTFVDYVTSLRMERAKELLLDNNLKTYEIAASVGYNDPQYFSSCFKRYTSQTPSGFRRDKGAPS